MTASRPRRSTGPFVWPAPRLLLRAALVLLALAVLLLWLELRQDSQGAIESLPAAQRQAILQRELATFAQMCRAESRSEALDALCRERAEFVLGFPECDASCRALVLPFTHKATR